MTRVPGYIGRDALTVAVNPECPAPAWWDAARLRARRELPVPFIFGGLLRGSATEVRVSPAQARIIREWCEAIPGWGEPDATHPLQLQ